MTTMSIAHRPRLAGQLMLGTRQAAGVLTGRHPDLVRQRCRPVACDVVTHVPLYDPGPGCRGLPLDAATPLEGKCDTPRFDWCLTSRIP